MNAQEGKREKDAEDENKKEEMKEEEEEEEKITCCTLQLGSQISYEMKQYTKFTGICHCNIE